jgi:hypothetical protein
MNKLIEKYETAMAIADENENYYNDNAVEVVAGTPAQILECANIIAHKNNYESMWLHGGEPRFNPNKRYSLRAYSSGFLGVTPC